MQEQEELLEEVAAYLHTYLKAGRLNVDTFSQKIHHNIQHFENLFVIRFLAKEETRQFVRRLPKLIRNFKTTTMMRKETNIAEIRGVIDWDETIRLRSQQNDKDRLTFVTNENRRSYDTPENVVLKHTLIMLYEYLFHHDYVRRFFEQDYLNEWKELRNNIEHAIRKNIYLKRVSHVNVSDRMIQNTRKHRNPLYREAASLLALYRNFMRGNYEQAELEQLLRETFILPNEVDVLFELYWVIQMMKLHTDSSTLHLMDRTSNIVASWEDELHLYEIYHDSEGPIETGWAVHVNELIAPENDYSRRIYDIHQKTTLLFDELFSMEKSNYHWGGRPDILLIKRMKETKNIVEITIGEVKYSNNRSTVSNGLEELITYMHLMKHNGRYNETIAVKGVLCVKDMSFNEDVVHDEIRVMTPSQIKNAPNR